MAVETIIQYIDLITIVMAIVLAMVAWFFRSKANAMEAYVAANRATREFMEVVMVSLEDLAVTDEEADAIKERCIDMVTAISAFIAALDDKKDPEAALTESIRELTE